MRQLTCKNLFLAAAVVLLAVKWGQLDPAIQLGFDSFPVQCIGYATHCIIPAAI